MILLGLGGNLPGPSGERPTEVLRAAVRRLDEEGIRISCGSAFYRTEPLGPPGQPRYVNAVVVAESDVSSEVLMSRLHAVEAAFGRIRGAARWEPRVLDIDLLDHDGRRCDGDDLRLPHPEIASRAFVLRPLCDVAPTWRHPATGARAVDLLRRLPHADLAGVIRGPAFDA